MTNKFSLVYIDDKPESALTKYLDKEFHSDDYEIECSEIIFNPLDGYMSLLCDAKVKSANIILIDSLLFENRTVTDGKFTGEEFKLILKKIFPFIEVIVITQNETNLGVEKISKYDNSSGKTASEYYSNLLPNRLDKAIANIRQYWLLAELVKDNDSWETVLKERVLATLKGTNTYDELKKADIDNLISAFQEMQESLDE